MATRKLTEYLDATRSLGGVHLNFLFRDGVPEKGGLAVNQVKVSVSRYEFCSWIDCCGLASQKESERIIMPFQWAPIDLLTLDNTLQNAMEAHVHE